jgi:hypothetical protein
MIVDSLGGQWRPPIPTGSHKSRGVERITFLGRFPIFVSEAGFDTAKQSQPMSEANIRSTA